MNVDIKRVREYLSSFDFQKLFIEELNWNSCTLRPIECPVGNECYKLSAIAELGGLVVYLVEPPEGGEIPPINERRKIEQQAKKSTHEHLLIFVDWKKTKSKWQWVRRSIGVQTANREFPYNRGQHGDLLLQKLNGIAFNINEFDKDGNVAIIKVLERVSTSFDVEKVTKKFYDEFKNEHDYFCEFLKGIDNQQELQWYASVMLNRIMFIYFIQKKGFLDGDQDYLKHKLDLTKKRGANQFYSTFLTRLFFEGFAKEEKTRSAEVNALLGKIPYLNGGLFLPHQLEVTYGKTITISDIVFERLFAFFDHYDWHLDYRPLCSEKEINPDVLGYIFEKYINQKQMGAYYTKEDITDYICKNTIIPFLFDKLENFRYNELHPFPMKDVEPYIYDAVKQAEYLPTETEREFQARETRYQQIKTDFVAGKIVGINDLITYNLDIRKFAEDWLSSIDDPVTLRAFYFHCLTTVTILDPTVGSGAFLFAALNLLEPLYEISLAKMEELGGVKYPDFAQELARVNLHPNREYFILKSIIVNNLFGVDIMEEAVEICKLRLFLKLVAQVDSIEKIEPLPDIDFNIKAGNSLVGYATLEEVQKAQHLDLSGARKEIEQYIIDTDIKLNSFRQLQTSINIPAIDITKAKIEVNASFKLVRDELNNDLAALYGARDVKFFNNSHQPFHWFVEFYGIMKKGGFDVIIGNPPFVEYSKVKDTYSIQGYDTEDSGNLYAFVMERSIKLLRNQGRFGLVSPVSLGATQRMASLRKCIQYNAEKIYYSSYADRPSCLFTGVHQIISICILKKSVGAKYSLESAGFNHWWKEEREYLLTRVSYVNATDAILENTWGKYSTNLELKIIAKIKAKKLNIPSYFSKYGKPLVITGGTGGYWLRAFDELQESNKYRIHYVADNNIQLTLCAVLNSTTFYWFWRKYSDGRDLMLADLSKFHFDYEQKADIVSAGQKHLISLKSTKEVREGKLTYEQYRPSSTKKYIDNIDSALAKHYGFTEEELDFIINYDIKYRMGKDNEEEE